MYDLSRLLTTLNYAFLEKYKLVIFTCGDAVFI